MSRREFRQAFFDAYAKHQKKEELTALETQLVTLMELHPEYLPMMQNPEKYLEQDYFPEMGETNPFLHLSLHLGLHEQVATNRPAGIQDLYQQYQAKYGSHEAEHRMMSVMAELLYQAQGQAPDQVEYLRLLKERLV